MDYKTVTFGKPCHDLIPSGLTIHESGVNYAIVSGTGTLTGKEYTHQTKIISRRLEAETENIVSVKEATLVSMANSGSVADRVLAYYSGAKTLSVPIVEGGERPGDAVYLEDAFGDLTEGLLQSMNIRISNTLRADTTIVTGYVPTHKGNDYNNRVLLTGEGEWTVPEGVIRAKCVLIGAGTGGAAGTNGNSGATVSLHYQGGTGTWTAGPGARGTGGIGGEAGQGGKIFEIEIMLAPGAKITYHAFPGGIAGQSGGAPGATGEDTTFGAYSSASGELMPTGYADGMTGDIYGAKGIDGIDGGDGGTGASSGGAGGTGEDVLSWTGGTGNTGWSGPSTQPTGTASIGGGGGSGAAYGENGKDSTGTGYVSSISGGANGANAHPHPANSDTSYGAGGSGGNGGGGGGGSGQLRLTVTTSSESSGLTAPGGTGGIRSVARDGAPGCVVIYF